MIYEPKARGVASEHSEEATKGLRVHKTGISMLSTNNSASSVIRTSIIRILVYPDAKTEKLN